MARAGMKATVVDRDRGWRALLKNVEALAQGAYAKVGILGDPAVAQMHIPGQPLTVPELASVHEFGTVDGTIPERSFIRATFDRQRAALLELTKRLVLLILDGKMDVARALNLLGAKLAGEIKKYVTEGAEVPPPNAPSVRARKEAKGAWNAKGAAQAAGLGVRTLIDTGRMIGAVTWAVIMDGRGADEAIIE